MLPEKISFRSKLILFIAVASLITSVFLPLWRIELTAPQYPEGLNLLLFSNKIGGNVEIINGLNHYIGMQTLHTENFIEFKILPYLMMGFALLILIGAIWANRKYVNTVFICFALFGIISMVDFYRWEYEYGHNLDPNAAIIVPGMAYQPPLIGFKQLLNFGAYSIPDVGGWLFILSGLLLLVVVVLENNLIRYFKKHAKTVNLILLLPIFSCNQTAPIPIVLNQDDCSHCKMIIVDDKFGCQMISSKGRVYKFDDIICLLAYSKANANIVAAQYYVHNFAKPGSLIDAKSAHYIKSAKHNSPMGGNILAFDNKQTASSLIQGEPIDFLSWQNLN